MNLDKARHLENILRENDNNGIVIAITGSWGVGKTFFWKKFLEKNARSEQERNFLPYSIKRKFPNFFDKKYAYISLFGIENLADLKTAICSNLSSNHFKEEVTPDIEIPLFVKKGLAKISTVNFSKNGFSGSVRLLDALLFLQVQDAIICFDDFERMSNKLDIKDVMGLANQLKLEKNCQVILILDEDKAEGDNKKKVR